MALYPSPYNKVIKWAKAKVHVISDSVLCLGRMYEHTRANAKWKDHLHDFQLSNAYIEFFGTDGEPSEFEWNIFPGHPGITMLEILQKIQEHRAVRQVNPEQFEDRIIFMSMFDDMDRTKRGNSAECFVSEEVKK